MIDLLQPAVLNCVAHSLGKTIQIITFLRGLFEAELVKSVLIVMPKVVLTNWSNEFAKWYVRPLLPRKLTCI